MSTTIRWLRLSDLHFREGKQHTWDENIVLQALLTDVRERMESDGLAPDFIAVTGDIAFGGKPAEYDLAAEFLDQLLELTGLREDRLFVVPGNHDVDRKVIGAGGALARSVTSREGLPSSSETNRLVDSYSASWTNTHGS